jgi:hypothetical protein
MPQRGFGTLSRQDIMLPAGTQNSGATALFVYSGQVAGFSPGFNSDSGQDFRDQLQILIETGLANTNQIVDWSANPPIPIVVPASWNANGSSGFPVIAVENATLNFSGGSDHNPPSGGPGLYIFADVTVQHGQLVSVQYQVSVRVKL